jgi:putative spermidine/putrescine transport system permease protein
MVFLVAGLGLGLAQSFGYQPFLPAWQWSLDGWREAFADPAVRASLVLTVRVSGTATLLATASGVLAALGIDWGSPRRTFARVIQLNLAVPHLVGALMVVLLLGQAGFAARLGNAMGLIDAPEDFPALTADPFGAGIIAAFGWKEAPFVAVLALTALGRGRNDLARAARTLGAGVWQRLWHVTLPVLTPPVTAAAILVFAFCAGSYEVPFLLGQPFPATMSVVAFRQYSSADLATRPEAMAIAVMLALGIAGAVAGYLAITARLSRRAP